jgi:acetyl esterase/lipase
MKFEQIRHRRIVHKIPGMDNVHIQKNIPYKQDAGVELNLDLYRPAQGVENNFIPGVLIVPSGPLKRFEKYPPKEWENVISWARLFAASGLGSVTIDHRFFSVGHLPLASHDVRDAVYFVHAHAPKFSLDPNRLCLLTFWGGGLLIHFAILENPVFLKCLVLYSPLLDMREMKRYQKVLPEDVMDAYSPGKCMSATNQLTLPIFLARARLDSKPLTASIDAFLVNATLRGVPLEVMCHETGRHAFEIRDDNARSHAIIERTIAFVKEHM